MVDRRFPRFSIGTNIDLAGIMSSIAAKVPLSTLIAAINASGEGTKIDPTQLQALAASKITSGIFSTSRIPNLAQSKITNLANDLAAKEVLSAKNAVNGYAGLDASSLLALAQIPSGIAQANIASLVSDLAGKLDDSTAPLSDTISDRTNWYGQDAQVQYDGTEYVQSGDTYVTKITWSAQDLSYTPSSIHCYGKLSCQIKSSGTGTAYVQVLEDGIQKGGASTNSTGYVTKTMQWLSDKPSAEIKVEIHGDSGNGTSCYLDETYLYKFPRYDKMRVEG